MSKGKVLCVLLVLSIFMMFLPATVFAASQDEKAIVAPTTVSTSNTTSTQSVGEDRIGTAIVWISLVTLVVATGFTIKKVRNIK